MLVDNQADLSLSNFGDCLPSSRVTNLPTPEWSDISNKPTWIKTQQFEHDLESFGGTLSLTRIRDPIRQAPDWVTIQQSDVAFSLFYGNLDVSRIDNLLSGGTADWNTLTNKPSWITSTQGGVALSSFSGNIDSSRINNLPSGGTAD